MATFYSRKSDAKEISRNNLKFQPGLASLLPLVEDLRAATNSPLLQNSLLGSAEPIFLHMHVSLLASLNTPLE